MSNNLTAVGLDLEWEEQDFTLSPISALVIAECMDSDGDITHVVMHTPGMTHVQAGGLIFFAGEWVKLNLMNNMVHNAYSEEE